MNTLFYFAYFPDLLNSMMKNGPPTTLMITAALTSFGAAIVLPIVSASKNVNAPESAANGMRCL